MNTQSSKRLYSLQEIARSWGVCEQTVRNYIKADRLKPIWIDNNLYISDEESIRYQKENSVIKLLKKSAIKLLKRSKNGMQEAR